MFGIGFRNTFKEPIVINCQNLLLKRLFILLIAVIVQPSLAQSMDSLKRRNIVKYNLSSMALYPKSSVWSYERITKPNQSFAITAGYLQFPNLKERGSRIDVEYDISKSGFTTGGEYRFYLKKENKYLAPHGVFIGPYSNMYQFDNNRKLSITSSDGVTKNEALLKSKLYIFNLGVQMGYQFVFEDRWAFEFIFMGPSLSRYSLDLKLNGTLDVSEEEILEDELLSAMVNRFPLIKEMLSDENVKINGKTSVWAAGFRYQLNVGYRFGKK